MIDDGDGGRWGRDVRWLLTGHQGHAGVYAEAAWHIADSGADSKPSKRLPREFG